MNLCSSRIDTMRKLEEITICNYKSIRQQTLKLNELNVFIGGNGARKSNLLSVFKLLQAIGAKQLQFHIAKDGGQNALLYFGKKSSKSMSVGVKIGDAIRVEGLEFKLTADNLSTLFLKESFIHSFSK